MSLSDEFVPNRGYKLGHHNDWVLGNRTPTTTVYYTLNSVTGGYSTSFNHKRSKDGTYRSGTYWSMQKFEDKVVPSESVIIFRYGYDVPAYEGKLVTLDHAYGTSYGNEMHAYPAFLALQTRGSEAWNRLRPDLPDFSMSASIMELKDPFNSIKDDLKKVVDKVARYKAARRLEGKSGISRSAEYYLGISFGVIPIISDIYKYAKAHDNLQKRLDQLIRDAGKPVRRKTNLKDNYTPQIRGYVGKRGYDGSRYCEHYPVLVTQCYGDGMDTGATTTFEHTSETWAEGSFYYYLPPGPKTVQWKQMMFDRIMGKRVTPADLYQIIPWSFLADYFTTLGDFVKANSAGVADNLVCGYAFLMQTVRQRRFTTSTSRVLVSKDGTKTVLLSSSMMSQRIMKNRVEASPFGFGVRQSDLSLKQQAIMAALGLARLP